MPQNRTATYDQGGGYCIHCEIKPASGRFFRTVLDSVPPFLRVEKLRASVTSVSVTTVISVITAISVSQRPASGPLSLQHPQERIDVAQIFEHDIGSAVAQTLRVVPACRHGNRGRTR